MPQRKKSQNKESYKAIRKTTLQQINYTEELRIPTMVTVDFRTAGMSVELKKNNSKKPTSRKNRCISAKQSINQAPLRLKTLLKQFNSMKRMQERLKSPPSSKSKSRSKTKKSSKKITQANSRNSSSVNLTCKLERTIEKLKEENYFRDDQENQIPLISTSEVYTMDECKRLEVAFGEFYEDINIGEIRYFCTGSDLGTMRKSIEYLKGNIYQLMATKIQRAWRRYRTHRLVQQYASFFNKKQNDQNDQNDLSEQPRPIDPRSQASALPALSSATKMEEKKVVEISNLDEDISKYMERQHFQEDSQEEYRNDGHNNVDMSTFPNLGTDTHQNNISSHSSQNCQKLSDEEFNCRKYIEYLDGDMYPVANAPKQRTICIEKQQLLLLKLNMRVQTSSRKLMHGKMLGSGFGDEESRSRLSYRSRSSRSSKEREMQEERKMQEEREMQEERKMQGERRELRGKSRGESRGESRGDRYKEELQQFQLFEQQNIEKLGSSKKSKKHRASPTTVRKSNSQKWYKSISLTSQTQIPIKQQQQQSRNDNFDQQFNLQIIEQDDNSNIYEKLQEQQSNNKAAFLENIMEKEFQEYQFEYNNFDHLFSEDQLTKQLAELKKLRDEDSDDEEKEEKEEKEENVQPVLLRSGQQRIYIDDLNEKGPDILEKGEAAVDIVFNGLLMEFLRDVTDTMIRNFKAAVSRPKIKRAKTKKNGFLTNQNQIKIFVKELCGFTVAEYPRILRNLEKSTGPTALEMLKYMHQSAEDEICLDEEEDDPSVMVLPNWVFDKIWITKSKAIKFETQGLDQEKQQQRQDYLKSLNKIFLRSCFDCLNECLDFERNFGPYGKPFPWKKSHYFEHSKTLEECQKSLERAQKKLYEISSTYCGIIIEKDEMNSLCGNEQYLSQVQEDRLSRMLAQDLVEAEDRWIFYDDQETELLVETGNIIFYELLMEIHELIINGVSNCRYDYN